MLKRNPDEGDRLQLRMQLGTWRDGLEKAIRAELGADQDGA
jgi:hypothetical protein